MLCFYKETFFSRRKPESQVQVTSTARLNKMMGRMAYKLSVMDWGFSASVGSRFIILVEIQLMARKRTTLITCFSLLFCRKVALSVTAR